MNALKAQWGVVAGLIPGEQMPEYTRVWNYTSTDYEADGNQRGEIYRRCAAEAHGYASDLERGGLNFATVQYLWL